MKYRNYIIFIITFHLCLNTSAQSDATQLAKFIKAKNLKNHVYFLASDSCNGRDVGTEGIETAKKYIIKNWQNTIQLKPYFHNSYTQSFRVVRRGKNVVSLESGEYTFQPYDDFMYHGKPDSSVTPLPIVFAGYGTEEDYDNINVENKAVLILHNNLRAASKVTSIAHKKGAKISIVANPEIPTQFSSISEKMKLWNSFKGYKLIDKEVNTKLFHFENDNDNYFTVSPKIIKQITSHKLNYWEKVAQKANNAHSGHIGEITYRAVKLKNDTISTDNIISYIPGTDTSSTIVVGAHYDHLGVIDGKVHYGADDNASGTAAVIELAKAFGHAFEQGYKPGKNIVFVTFSAEEGGIEGSEYFLYKFDKDKNINLMLNIDMIGRCDSKHADNCNYFYFIQDNLPDSVVSRNEEICKLYNVNPDYSSSVKFSDHRPFADKGISTIFYFDGKHQDLHRPTDTPDKIDYSHMEKITRIIFETIWLNAGVAKK